MALPMRKKRTTLNPSKLLETLKVLADPNGLVRVTIEELGALLDVSNSTANRGIKQLQTRRKLKVIGKSTYQLAQVEPAQEDNLVTKTVAYINTLEAKLAEKDKRIEELEDKLKLYSDFDKFLEKRIGG